MFNKVQITFFTILFSSCLISCVNEDENRITGPIYTNGKFHDETDQENFIRMLEMEKVEYDFVDNNYFRFSINDTAKVLGIKRKVLYGNELKTNVQEGFVVQGNGMREEYENAFKDADIPYWIDNIEEASDAWSINFWQVYGPEADSIKQKLDIEYSASINIK
jgi:hypothetical protein